MNTKDKLTKLEKAWEVYPSDKKGHGYFPVYAEYLPDTCIWLIEVGVANGYSAKIWDFFYDHNVDIHLVDLFLNKAFVSPRWARENGFVPWVGSQSDVSFLGTINVQANVITEDASHNCFDQIVTWKHMFVNNLQTGGVYFLEDTHTSQPQEKFYWGNGVETFEDTPLWLFKNFIQTGKIQNKFFSEGEAEVFESLIDWVKIEADEKMIIIKKK